MTWSSHPELVSVPMLRKSSTSLMTWSSHPELVSVPMLRKSSTSLMTWSSHPELVSVPMLPYHYVLLEAGLGMHSLITQHSNE
jgi:hypothetical protein